MAPGVTGPWGCHALCIAHWTIQGAVVGITLCPYLLKARAGDAGGKDICILCFSGCSGAQMLCHLPDAVGHLEHQRLFPDVPAQGHDECWGNPASAVHFPPGILKMALQARKNLSRLPWELGRCGVLVRTLVLAPLSLPLMPDSQGAQEAGRGSGHQGRVPLLSHPPTIP